MGRRMGMVTVMGWAWTHAPGVHTAPAGPVPGIIKFR